MNECLYSGSHLEASPQVPRPPELLLPHPHVFVVSPDFPSRHKPIPYTQTNPVLPFQE